MPRQPHPLPVVKFVGDGSVRPGDLVGFDPQPDPPADRLTVPAQPKL